MSPRPEFGNKLAICGMEAARGESLAERSLIGSQGVNGITSPVCGSAVFDGMRSLSTACVARTARRVARCNLGATETTEREVRMAVLGQHGRRRSAVPGLGEMVGSDVEVKCSSGQVYRGTLRSVGSDYLGLERASDGRNLLVKCSAVVAVVDECPPSLRPAGRRHAEDAEDWEAE
jgi:hypothetical protein